MLYYISRALLRLAFRLLGGLESVGKENIPATGGVILAPNHISYLDPPAAGLYVPRQVHFMAKDELFRSKLLGAWMRRVGAFPVRRGTADRKAIRHTLDLLAQGRVVCVFPEGTRSPDGRLQKAELGIGMLALKSRAPVAPALITGTDRALPSHAKRPHRHPMKVVYGKPLTFLDLYGTGDSRQAMEEVGRRIMSAIADLAEGCLLNSR